MPQLEKVYGVKYYGQREIPHHGAIIPTLKLEHFLTLQEAEDRIIELRADDRVEVHDKCLDEIEYDPVLVKELLDGLARVHPENWDQDEGNLYEENLEFADDGECRACAFAWAAHFLKAGYNGNEERWEYGEGWEETNSILHLEEYDSRRVFHANGASDHAASSDRWSGNLYDVFADVFRERLGFEHERPELTEAQRRYQV